MADMTHKHHNLIYDAIKEASEDFLRSPELVDVVDKLGIGNAVQARRLNRAFVCALAKSFSSKLRYTNDKFEARQWQAQVLSLSDETYKDWQVEISKKPA